MQHFKHVNQLYLKLQTLFENVAKKSYILYTQLVNDRTKKNHSTVGHRWDKNTVLVLSWLYYYLDLTPDFHVLSNKVKLATG